MVRHTRKRKLQGGDWATPIPGLEMHNEGGPVREVGGPQERPRRVSQAKAAELGPFPLSNVEIEEVHKALVKMAQRYRLGSRSEDAAQEAWVALLQRPGLRTTTAPIAYCLQVGDKVMRRYAGVCAQYAEPVNIQHLARELFEQDIDIRALVEARKGLRSE